MILLAVDLCFYESFNIILTGGVPVGCVDAETYILQTLWNMNGSGWCYYFILIFAFGDLILSRLCK